ncbi:LOW QUALITY PROTEIN: complement C5-like [Callospermophilus lateralis]
MGLILCFLIFLEKSLGQGQEQIYVISAPNIFHVGASENIVIQAYGYTEAFDATVSIKSYPDKKISYSSSYVILSPENKFQNSAILTIQPKQLSGEQGSVSYVYLEVVSKHFSKSKKMPISYDNGYLFIHTDKPVYTPHQSVKVRVYSLNDDWKPAKRKTVLTFIDPEGSEVDTVEENDYTGIISFPDFKIPSNPIFGVWTIKAKYKEDFSTTGATYFQIKKYVLPHFSVSIEPEGNFIGYKNFKNFEITIKARYFYNKTVTEAEVYVTFGIREDVKDDQKEMMPKAMQNTKLINGTALVTFDSEAAVKELSYHSLEELNNKYLYIAVTVKESTGGFFEEAEVPGIKYVLSPYKLNLIATSFFLKPGIPYSIKVQVKDSLDQLVGGVPVTLNAQTINENQEMIDLEPQKSITGLNDGVAKFVVNLPFGVTALEFDVKTDAPDLPEENQASIDYRAIAYSSPSQSYLYIDWTGNYNPLLVGEYLNITVTSKSLYIDKITQYNYLVLSRGKIVHFGTREKVIDSTYQSINIPVTQNMVPSAQLLVYYIVIGEQTAELVSDSVCLNVEEKRDNQLQVHSLYSPGQTVCINLATESESWVAVTAVDSAVYGVQGRARKPIERAFQALEKSDLGCGAGGGRDNADVFHLAGLTFLTNAEDSQDYAAFKIKNKFFSTVLNAFCVIFSRIFQQFLTLLFLPVYTAPDEAGKEIKLSSSGNLQQRINEQAAKYKHPGPRKCCCDGAHRNDEETCEQRATWITKGPACVRAFKECCIIANQYRANTSHKEILLLGKNPRLQIDTLQPGVDLGSETLGETSTLTLSEWNGVYLGKPHFSILVQPENYYISHENFEDFKITINARYSHNQNVSEAEVSVIFAIRNDLEDHRKEEMPEAIQKAQVQVKDVFGHVVGGNTVILKAKIVGATQESKDLDPMKSTTDHRGVASFMVDISPGVSALEFHVRTDDPGLPEEYQASRDYRAVTYSSPSQSFLSLSWADSYKSLLVGEKLSITVTPKSPYVDKIAHYVYLISSKGKIVHFGTEKKLPGSSYQTLKLPVTQHMVPTAHLLVYYIITVEQTAELVSDSVCLNIEEKCGQQLQIRLSPDKEIHSPGGAVSLIMDTQSEMWVALTAVDSATYGIQGRSKNPLERVLGALDKSDQGCGASGGRSNAEVFYSAGLTVLTNTDMGHSLQNGYPVRWHVIAHSSSL